MISGEVRSASEKVSNVLEPNKWRTTTGNEATTFPDVNNEPDAADKSPESRNAKEEEFDNEKCGYSYFQLFRYATVWELHLIVIGVILAILAAINAVFLIVIYGEFISLLVDRTLRMDTSSPTFILHLFGGGKKLTNASKEENLQAIRDDGLAFGIGTLVGAVVELIFIALAIDILNRAAMTQITKIQKLLLKSILRQDMSWFDTTSGNNFASKMSEDLQKMKEGMGEKIAVVCFLTMSFVFGLIASVFYGWKLTVVAIFCCPFIIISTAIVTEIQSSLTEKELKAYAGAAAVAEEVFSGIRTVFAFSGETNEYKRFAKLLKPAEIGGRKKGLYSGIGSGVNTFIIYACYALSMWYGVKLILADREEEVRHYTPAIMVIILFGIIMGAQSLGYSTPHIEAFTAAKCAAQNVFSIIDRKPIIDSMNEQGHKPAVIAGNIEFECLHFCYPARPNVKILEGLGLSAKVGQTVALVGASGCGKSTLLQLMQRFYDPINGSIKLDGYDLRELNVKWLREQIGVVEQEPVLLSTTIGENIRYGKPTASQNEIEDAARLANCHDFIIRLPKGYDTLVGERGSQMSVGEKQRIAIARALVRNPKILLLDEATSALDSTSERHVQDAFMAAIKGRTTLLISHRPSIVTNADKIVFVKDGTIAEEGTHDELMGKEGLYYQFVNITNRMEKSGLNADDSSDLHAQKENDKHSYKDNTATDDSGNLEGDENKETTTGQSKDEDCKISFRQLWVMNSPERKYILFGCLAAIVHGVGYPVWAISFADAFAVMAKGDNEYVVSKVNFFSFLFVVFGIVAGLATLMQIHMLNIAVVKMTSRLRQKAFKAILSQEVAYFDDEKNSVGALCARLSSDCSNVQGATGAQFGYILQAFFALIVGTVMSFIISWNLTLATLVITPFLFLSIFFESRFIGYNAYAEKLAVENALQVAIEAIANIRTVLSLGQEKSVLDRYNVQIDSVNIAYRNKTRFRGIVVGLGQVAPFIAYGISMYYGGLLVANDGLPFDDIIKVSEALILGSWMLGQAFAYAPNVSAAILSASRLQKLFDRIPALHDPQDKPFNTAEKIRGDITYENVDFHYSNRSGMSVLNDLNLGIRSGMTVALVGSSGSGKSSCVQLLLRYYDPAKGQVNLSGCPTTEFSFDTLRSQMAIVSQEPFLFDRTIAENIAYGNNFSEDIPMSQIIEAAKKSNIHAFIASLPMGYKTLLGNKGAQLSVGQKQRIAIARALVRNPKILVLDEATSALDLKIEKVVQEALDAARFGRTCLIIAHRLTAVRGADLICILKEGVIVEKGSHDELMALNGIYAALHCMQHMP